MNTSNITARPFSQDEANTIAAKYGSTCTWTESIENDGTDAGLWSITLDLPTVAEGNIDVTRDDSGTWTVDPYIGNDAILSPAGAREVARQMLAAADLVEELSA